MNKSNLVRNANCKLHMQIEQNSSSYKLHLGLLEICASIYIFTKLQKHTYKYNLLQFPAKMYTRITNYDYGANYWLINTYFCYGMTSNDFTINDHSGRFVNNIDVCINMQHYVCGFSDIVCMLGITPGTVLHTQIQRPTNSLFSYKCLTGQHKCDPGAQNQS